MTFRTLSVLMIVLTLLAIAPQSSFAQNNSGQLPGIVATGLGVAREPAQRATMQFLVGSSMAYGTGGAMMEPIEAGPGTPVAMGPEMMGDPFAKLTAESLDPIVQALVSAGATEDAVELTAPVESIFMGPGGPDIGQIMVNFEPVNPALMADLATAVKETAESMGLTVLLTGADYEPADCGLLVQAAREAAIADAQMRANGLAAALGVALGDLVRASDDPYVNYSSRESCAPEGTETFFGPYGSGTFPTFDSKAVEAIASVQVTLTYAIETAA